MNCPLDLPVTRVVTGKIQIQDRLLHLSQRFSQIFADSSLQICQHSHQILQKCQLASLLGFWPLKG